VISTINMNFKPRCARPPRLHRGVFRSPYRFEPVRGPFRWLNPPAIAAAALGVTVRKLGEWRRATRQGNPIGPPWTIQSGKIMYRYDDLYPGADFVAELRASRRALVEQTSVHDYAWHRNQHWGAKAKAYRARKADAATTS
jgi:hypothetical protein